MSGRDLLHLPAADPVAQPVAQFAKHGVLDTAPGLLHSGEVFTAGTAARRFLSLASARRDPPSPW